MYLCEDAISSIDHQTDTDYFATSAGSVVHLWHEERAEPVKEYSWGTDTITKIRFNPVETSLFASAGHDRTICLYDTRTNAPLRKLLLNVSHYSIVIQKVFVI